MMGPHIFHWSMMQHCMVLGACLFEEQSNWIQPPLIWKRVLGSWAGRCSIIHFNGWGQGGHLSSFSCHLNLGSLLEVPVTILQRKLLVHVWVKLKQETSGDIQPLLWTVNLFVLWLVWHPRGPTGACDFAGSDQWVLRYIVLLCQGWPLRHQGDKQHLDGLGPKGS